MSGYVVNFTVYTMAMLGLICFAVFVYKKVMEGGFHKKTADFLSVEETMSLTPRKTLHIIRAGNERFLIASDIDKTTLISKLSDDNIPIQKSFERFMNTEKDTDNHINSIYPIEDILSENTQEVNIPIQLEALSSATKTLSRQSKNSLDSREPKQNYKNNQSQALMQEMAKKINEL